MLFSHDHIRQICIAADDFLCLEGTYQPSDIRAFESFIHDCPVERLCAVPSAPYDFTLNLAVAFRASFPQD